MEIYFVTSNQNKLKEAQNILKKEIKSIDLDIPEIQAIYVEEVIKDKALKAYERVKKPVLVEDTGLYIKSWNDFPGALIHWLLETINIQGIFRLLENYKNKEAYAETGLCLYDGNEFHIFIGKIYGVITEPKGEYGFGWDPIFKPKGYGITFAEMKIEEKNKISMRKEAFLKLKKYLDSVFL